MYTDTGQTPLITEKRDSSRKILLWILAPYRRRQLCRPFTPTFLFFEPFTTPVTPAIRDVYGCFFASICFETFDRSWNSSAKNSDNLFLKGGIYFTGTFRSSHNVKSSFDLSICLFREGLLKRWILLFPISLGKCG